MKLTKAQQATAVRLTRDYERSMRRIGIPVRVEVENLAEGIACAREAQATYLEKCAETVTEQDLKKAYLAKAEDVRNA